MDYKLATQFHLSIHTLNKRSIDWLIDHIPVTQLVRNSSVVIASVTPFPLLTIK